LNVDWAFLKNTESEHAPFFRGIPLQRLPVYQ